MPVLRVSMTNLHAGGGVSLVGGGVPLIRLILSTRGEFHPDEVETLPSIRCCKRGGDANEGVLKGAVWTKLRLLHASAHVSSHPLSR